MPPFPEIDVCVAPHLTTTPPGYLIGNSDSEERSPIASVVVEISCRTSMRYPKHLTKEARRLVEGLGDRGHTSSCRALSSKRQQSFPARRVSKQAYEPQRSRTLPTPPKALRSKPCGGTMWRVRQVWQQPRRLSR